MKCDELKQVENPIKWGLYYDKAEVDEAIAELKAELAEKDKDIAELKKSLEQKKIAEGSVCRILWNLVDSGIIKEWYFNGEYNVLLNADDPHIQISELKTKIDKVSLKFCKQLRHSNHKRCLDMARWCEAEALKCLTQQGAMIGFPWTDRFQYLQWQITHYSRWHRIWLRLAEKFKEENR